MKARHAGILSTVLAGACCVPPLLLAAAGLGGGAAFVGRYQGFFLMGGVAVLTWAWTKYLRERAICDCEHGRGHGQHSGIFTLLVATVLVLGFLCLDVSRYVVARTSASAEVQTELANGVNRIVIPVDGMTCATCEIPVRFVLKRTDGVKVVRISAAGKTVTVDYEPSKTNLEKRVAAINSAGFRASLPNN